MSVEEVYSIWERAGKFIRDNFPGAVLTKVSEENTSNESEVKIQEVEMEIKDEDNGKH